MKSNPLNYATKESRLLLRWHFWLFAGVGGIVFLIAAFLISGMTVKHDEMWIDPVTCSTAGKSTWLFGMTSGLHITNVSPLEARLNGSGIRWTRSWSLMNDLGSTVFGRMTSCGIGSMPPIYQMHMALKEFADASTDAQLREFVRVMQSGKKGDQEAAVDAAFQKVIESSFSAGTGSAEAASRK